MRRDGFHRYFNPRWPLQIYYSFMSNSTHNHIELVLISESYVAEAPSLKTMKMDQMLRRYRKRRKTLGLTRSAILSLIIMRFCWLLLAIHLSCRAFFRRPLMCHCRRFVSDCVSFSSCNQLVIIGPRMKWRFRQLSFPSAKWYGDVIWIFDPGITGTRIDNEGELKRWFMQTPVHNIVSRQGQRIWWKRDYVILDFTNIPQQIFALDISINQGSGQVGRPSVVNFNASFWRCLLGTRFSKWYSSFQQLWALAITKKDVISCCWGCFDGKRCNRWIATNDRFKVYWSSSKER